MLRQIRGAVRRCAGSYSSHFEGLDFEQRHSVVGFWVSCVLGFVSLGVASISIMLSVWIFWEQQRIQVKANEIQVRQVLEMHNDRQREEAMKAARAFSLNRVEPSK